MKTKYLPGIALRSRTNSEPTAPSPPVCISSLLSSCSRVLPKHTVCLYPPSPPPLTKETNPFADRFSKLIINGIPEASEWISIRQTKNYQSNSGVTSVTSPDMRCFQNRPGSSTATVAVGDELGFVAVSAITHFGPVQFYMAMVPEGANVNTWDPAGNVWFKVASISAQGKPLGSGVETWPAYRMFFLLLVPSSTPIKGLVLS